MFADRLTITRIMMLLDQTVEQRLRIGPPHLPELDGADIRQFPLYGRLVYLYPKRFMAMHEGERWVPFQFSLPFVTAHPS